MTMSKITILNFWIFISPITIGMLEEVHTSWKYWDLKPSEWSQIETGCGSMSNMAPNLCTSFTSHNSYFWQHHTHSHQLGEDSTRDTISDSVKVKSMILMRLSHLSPINRERSHKPEEDMLMQSNLFTTAEKNMTLFQSSHRDTDEIVEKWKILPLFKHKKIEKKIFFP